MMRAYQKLTYMLTLTMMLSGCQAVQEGWQSAQDTVDSSSQQFKRFVASLHMQRYVPGIPDMPVYQGFEPKGNENAVYDVVAGRIIDITYSSTLVDLNKVQDYYDIALVQLGWKATGQPYQYQRDDELLTLKITASGQKVILHILLQPADK